jgi:hypothetical protein
MKTRRLCSRDWQLLLRTGGQLLLGFFWFGLKSPSEWKKNENSVKSNANMLSFGKIQWSPSGNIRLSSRCWRNNLLQFLSGNISYQFPLKRQQKQFRDSLNGGKVAKYKNIRCSYASKVDFFPLNTDTIKWFNSKGEEKINSGFKANISSCLFNLYFLFVGYKYKSFIGNNFTQILFPYFKKAHRFIIFSHPLMCIYFIHAFFFCS